MTNNVAGKLCLKIIMHGLLCDFSSQEELLDGFVLFESSSVLVSDAFKLNLEYLNRSFEFGDDESGLRC